MLPDCCLIKSMRRSMRRRGAAPASVRANPGAMPMSIRNFDKLFHPQHVALIGASERPGSVGAVVARNLLRAGFDGELLLVNPHLTSLDGVRVYRDVASLPHPPDLAIIATPPDTVPGLLAELGARGVRAAIVITA